MNGIHENNVGVGVPAPGVWDDTDTSLAIVNQLERSILVEDSKFRRATRSTSHPEDQRISRRVVLGLKEPIEEGGAICLVDLNLPSVLVERGRLLKSRKVVELEWSLIAVHDDDQHCDNAEKGGELQHCYL